MPRPRLLQLAALALAVGLGTVAGAPAAAQAQSGGKEQPPVFNLVRFEPIIVTLFDSNRAIGLMTVTLALQVPSQADKEAIEAQRLKYIDAFNAALVQLGRLHVSPNRPINVPLLASTLEDTANRMHPKGEVRALVLDASTRRLG